MQAARSRGNWSGSIPSEPGAVVAIEAMQRSVRRSTVTGIDAVDDRPAS